MKELQSEQRRGGHEGGRRRESKLDIWMDRRRRQWRRGGEGGEQ